MNEQQKAAAHYGRALRRKRTKKPPLAHNIIRRCIFRPYLKGMGPTFCLTMWDTGRFDGHTAHCYLGYRLTMRESGKPPVVLFEGEDYGCPPCHSTYDDASVEGLMGFLTVRPGDTDKEYFANYTPEQLDYCSQHAEALAAEVQARFCDEDGNVREGGRR